MKKKSLNSKKLLLKKAVIASMHESAVKGGVNTANFPTIQGPDCVTVFLTNCENQGFCNLFDTQDFACRTRK